MDANGARPIKVPFAVFGLAAIIVLDLVALGPDLKLIAFVQSGLDGAALTESDGTAIDAEMAGIGQLQLLATVVTGVLFLTWFYRTRKALDAPGEDFRYGSGWTIGGFFVPVLNLVRPYQVMSEVWEVTVRRAAGGGSTNNSGIVVGLWWVTLLASGGLGRIAGVWMESAEALSEFRTAAFMLLASDLVNVVAAVLAIVMIVRLSRMHAHAEWTAPEAPEPVGA